MPTNKPASEASPKRRTSFDPADLRARLRVYDRSPFLEVLALFVENMPTEEALRKFADAYPDRWASALGNIGALGGFTTKTEQTSNININVGKMSDSQLEDALKKKLGRLVIDETPIEVQTRTTENEKSDNVRRMLDAPKAATPRRSWTGKSDTGLPTGVVKEK